MTNATRKEKINENERKYNILKYINRLPYNEYEIARNKLPIALKVSKRTFERWTYLAPEDNLEIPVNKIAIISKYLGCSIEELINTPIPQYNTAKLKKLTDDTFAKKLGMVQ